MRFFSFTRHNGIFCILLNFGEWKTALREQIISSTSKTLSQLYHTSRLLTKPFRKTQSKYRLFFFICEQSYNTNFILQLHHVFYPYNHQLLFAMDPALQPRARNLYEKFATNRVAEGHLMKALIKFYVGGFDHICFLS